MISRRVHPIGIDITSRHVTVAQCRRGARGLHVLEAVRFRRHAPSEPFAIAEARRMTDVLVRRGLTGRQVVVGVPETALATTSMAPVANIPMELTARADLARLMSRSPETLSVAVLEPPGSPTSTHLQRHGVLSVGCSDEDCEPMLAAIEEAGLEIVRLAPRAAALAELATLIHGTLPLAAIIDLGDDATTTTVVENDTIKFLRAEPRSITQLNARPSRTSGVTSDLFEQSLQGALAALSFAAQTGSSGATPHVYLTGPDARSSVQAANRVFECECRLLCAPQKAPSATPPCGDPSLACAIGLSCMGETQ